MPLTEDSRALLALLLGKGKSYADIAGLLGTDEAEVRQRGAAALAEIDSSQPAPDATISDFLLGQSDPIARAEVRTRLASDPALASQVDSLADQLRLLVPGANIPNPASPEGGKPAVAAVPESTDSGAKASKSGISAPSSFSSVTGHQRRLIALLLAGALLAVVLVLLLTGVFGGSGSNDDDAPEAAKTVAVLSSVEGQQGEGMVQFGFSGSEFAANLDISNLKPSKKGQGYVLWLYGSSGAFPLHASEVGKSGAIGGQIAVNEAVICLVASDVFPSVRVSRTNDRAFNRALNQSNVSNEQNPRLPKYTGQTVLEGPISMPQDAKDRIIPICNGTANQTSE